MNQMCRKQQSSHPKHKVNNLRGEGSAHMGVHPLAPHQRVEAVRKTLHLDAAIFKLYSQRKSIVGSR